MNFTVIIPARLASSRLPNKPLADIAGLPMVVRVAQAAKRSAAAQVVVAADDALIVEACAQHGVQAILTAKHHASGSDRLAEAVNLLHLPDSAVVVNVQGDEPLIEPALIDKTAQKLIDLMPISPGVSVSTCFHAIDSIADYQNPNVVKVVANRAGLAINFSRAPTPFWRDGFDASTQQFKALPHPPPLRHIGLYAYTAGFLRQFPTLAPAPNELCESLEQLRVLWHGYSIALVEATQAPGPGVDTPEDLARVRAIFAGLTL